MIETIYVNNIKENHRFKTFWNWSVNELCEETSLTRYCEEDVSCLDDDETIRNLLDAVCEDQTVMVSEYSFYVVFQTGLTHDHRINNYYRLWKGFRHELKVSNEDCNFLEDIITENRYSFEDNKIKFAGVLRFKWHYFINVISHFGTPDIIFALKKDQDIDFDKLENEIVNESDYAKKINVLINKNGIVFFPHGSEDFGGIYLDILKK